MACHYLEHLNNQSTFATWYLPHYLDLWPYVTAFRPQKLIIEKVVSYEFFLFGVHSQHTVANNVYTY